MQAAQRNMYDRGCSAVGAKMRYIGTADTAPTVEELEAAITPATAAVFMSSFLGAMPLCRWKQWWRWPTVMGCP